MDEIAPQADPLQPVPDTVHVTPVFVVPDTEAANCFVVPTAVENAVGVTTMATTCAVAVPLRLIAVVPPVDELLVMVSEPVAAPATVGLNCILRVWLWPGLSVSGNVAPDILNPEPVRTAELIVTAWEPTEAKVRSCGVAAVLTCTLPNAKLLELTVRVGVAAFNCSKAVLDTVPAVAVSVAACEVVTGDTVAVNAVFVAFAGTVIEAGTLTAALLLDRATVNPLLGAAAVKLTVMATVPDPVMGEPGHDSPLRDAVAVPVPLKAIAEVAPADELLVTVSWPVTAPGAVGTNCTLRVAACPGLKVSGKVAPDTPKPTPVGFTELIVRGALPEEVKVRDCVGAAVFTCTLPKARPEALIVSFGCVAAGFSCSRNHLVTPPPTAISTGDCAVATDEAVAVKTPVIEPFCTVTLAGTFTAVLLLDRLNVSGEVAAELRSTVQASVPAPVMVTILQ